jgi:phage repressor protein C with HTH and peptisase S24 domain
MRDALGYTQQDLSAITGIPLRSLKGYEMGERKPRSDALAAIARTGVNIHWLVTGEGEMRAESAHGIYIGNERQASPQTELVMVPLVAARLSAGGGSWETDGDVTGHYAFRSDWIRRKGDPSRMVLMEIAGDSMEPELRDGDLVLVDQSQYRPMAGRIYAIGMDDVVVVKVVDVEPEHLVLRSFNQAYTPLRVLPDAVRILGRVIWSCRER